MPIIVRKKKKLKAATTSATTTTTKSSISNTNDNGNELHNSIKSQEAIVKEVDVAVSNLKRGIRKMLQKHNSSEQSQSLNRMMDHGGDVLSHMHHCIVHLQQHVNVLQIGLHCFMNQLLPSIYTVIANHNNHRIQTSTKKNHQQQQQTIIKDAIQHVFYWLLHLHDGYIYTISGECRHVYDQQKQQQKGETATRTKFQSQLTTKVSNDDRSSATSKQRDTLTSKTTTTTSSKRSTGSCAATITTSTTTSQLYSSDNIYSGTSWDEYMDPINGLRHRLLYTILQQQQLHHHHHPRPNHHIVFKSDDYESLWDEITMGDDMNSPGYALEQIITQIEQQMLHIQMIFTKLTGKEQYLCRLLQKALSTTSQQQIDTKGTTTIPTVTLHWKDKMESLRISCSGIFGATSLLFERYGNTFQTVHHTTESVLPLHYTTSKRWWSTGGMEFIIPPPPQNDRHCNVTNKKRRIIATNEDDDDVDIKSKIAGTDVQQKSSLRELASNNINVNNKTSSGLVVTMKSQDTGNSKINSTNQKESVNDIKLQFGINVHARENAFDTVQAEEAGATFDAEQIDQDETNGNTSLLDENDAAAVHWNSTTTTTYDTSAAANIESDWTIDDEIHHAQQRVKRSKRAYSRLLSQPNHDDDDEFNTLDVNVWNAREVLREALMSAGELLLWSVERRRDEKKQNENNQNTAASLPIQHSTIDLPRAIQYFRSASGLVLEQQKLHKAMNPDASKDVLTYTFFCRNLLLLQIKAQINIGIGYIQYGIYGHPSERDPKRAVQFETAALECQTAFDLCETMDEGRYAPRAYVPTPTYERDGEDDLIIRRDQLEARQLRPFSLRWKATALWYLYNKSESFSTVKNVAECAMLQCDPFIQNVWSMARKVSNESSKKNDITGLIDVLIDVYLETYYAWTTIADLAASSLERTAFSAIRELSQQKSYYDTLLDYVERSLSNAAKVSETLQNDLEQAKLSERYEELCSCNRILPAHDLVQSTNDIKEWWNRRRLLVEKLSRTKQSSATTERGDLFSNAQHQSLEDLPTQRFVLQPHIRRSKYNLGGNGSGRSATGSSDRTSKLGHRNANTDHRNGKAMLENDRRLKGQDKTHQYRKWREDMKYDPDTDSYIPDLVYPAIAPPMPLHIQEILKNRSKCWPKN